MTSSPPPDPADSSHAANISATATAPLVDDRMTSSTPLDPAASAASDGESLTAAVISAIAAAPLISGRTTSPPPEAPAAAEIDDKMEKFTIAEPTPPLAAVDSVADVSSSSTSEEESSDSESEDSSTSSSSSSASSDEPGDEEMIGGPEEVEDEEEMVMWAEEEVEVHKGPIKSKHEIEDLPPVPLVEVSLELHHQTTPVGVVSSIMGNRVIVEGLEKHIPLSEGSILWITETRLPLGLVDEIFGPVKNPYYIVRYNSDEEVPAGISMGSAVSFVTEFANHVINQQELYKKGYDASGENDGESTDEMEFSDDEKEAEYRRSLRQSKRVANNTREDKQETRSDKRPNFKCGTAGDTSKGKRASAMDLKKTNFKGPPRDGRWNGNQVPADHMRNNSKVLPSQESMVAPLQRRMQPYAPFTSAAGMGQSVPNAPGPVQTQLASVNLLRPYGTSPASREVHGSYPAASATTPQPVQFSTVSSDPSQRLLVQQINALMANVERPQQLQMVTQAGHPTNGLPSPQLRDTTYHTHQQNQALSGSSNAVPGQQQFTPNIAATTNSRWFGGPLPACPAPQGTQAGMHSVQFSPTSYGAGGQSIVSQVPFGCANAPEQGAWGAGNGRSYGQPQPVINQGGMHLAHSHQSIRPTSQGQSSAVQIGLLLNNTPVAHSHQSIRPTSQGQSSAVQIGLPLNNTPVAHSHQSIRPTSQGKSSAVQIGLPLNNTQDPWASSSFNAQNDLNSLPFTNQVPLMQFTPSMSPTTFGPPGHAQFGASGSVNVGSFGHAQNMQEQGAQTFSNLQNYQQHQPSTDQYGMRPPMQFNQSAGPTSLGQHPPTNEQGGLHPSMQFNPGRSSFHGSQRGGHHRSFGRGGQPQTR